MPGRRQFLRSAGCASILGVVGMGGTSAVATASHTGETIATYSPWGSTNRAELLADNDGEINLVVNGTRVYDVDDPMWMDWEDDYLAVSDAGDIKVVDDSARTPDTEKLTSRGNDMLPTISREDLQFGRGDDVYEIANFASRLGGWSSPTPRQSRGYLSNNIDLPGGGGGGRNAGGKKVWKKWETDDFLVQIRRPDGSTNNYFGKGPVLAANLDIYKVNTYGSNTQLLNFHVGYEKQPNKHCIVVFTEASGSPAVRVCAPNVERIKRKGKRAVSKAIRKSKAGGRKLIRVARPAAKLIARLAVMIGGAAFSFLFS